MLEAAAMTREMATNRRVGGAASEAVLDHMRLAASPLSALALTLHTVVPCLVTEVAMTRTPLASGRFPCS